MKRIHNIFKASALTLLLLVPFSKPQTTDTKNKIGNYTIPKDPLQDNYCQKVDLTEFHNIKNIETEYQAFFLGRVTDLREPVYEFVKSNKYVRI